jgi:hypothetical protein
MYSSSLMVSAVTFHPVLFSQGMIDLAQRHPRWRDVEDRVADPLQPIQIGVVVTTPADSFEHDPLPVTNSADPLVGHPLFLSSLILIVQVTSRRALGPQTCSF